MDSKSFEQSLQDYLDGALDNEAIEAFLLEVGRNPAYADRLRKEKALNRLLANRPKPAAPETLSVEVLTALRADPTVEPIAKPRRSTMGRIINAWPARLAMAATLLAVVGVSVLPLLSSRVHQATPSDQFSLAQTRNDGSGQNATPFAALPESDDALRLAKNEVDGMLGNLKEQDDQEHRVLALSMTEPSPESAPSATAPVPLDENTKKEVAAADQTSSGPLDDQGKPMRSFSLLTPPDITRTGEADSEEVPGAPLAIASAMAETTDAAQTVPESLSREQILAGDTSTVDHPSLEAARSLDWDFGRESEAPASAPAFAEPVEERREMRYFDFFEIERTQPDRILANNLPEEKAPLQIDQKFRDQPASKEPDTTVMTRRREEPQDRRSTDTEDQAPQPAPKPSLTTPVPRATPVTHAPEKRPFTGIPERQIAAPRPTSTPVPTPRPTPRVTPPPRVTPEPTAAPTPKPAPPAIVALYLKPQAARAAAPSRGTTPSAREVEPRGGQVGGRRDVEVPTIQMDNLTDTPEIEAPEPLSVDRIAEALRKNGVTVESIEKNRSDGGTYLTCSVEDHDMQWVSQTLEQLTLTRANNPQQARRTQGPAFAVVRSSRSVPDQPLRFVLQVYEMKR